MLKLNITVLSCFLFLGGCQMMNVTECEIANWEALGQQDGLKGYASMLESRVKSCEKNHITVSLFDKQRYQDAYQKSILNYCTPENIYQLSILGQARINACPEPNYSQIKKIHDVASNFYKNEQELKDLSKKVEEIDDEIDQTTDKDKRYQLLEEQRILSKKLDRLQKDKLQLNKELQQIKPKN